MLTSFFNKSKPINFLLVTVCMSVYFCLYNFVFFQGSLTVSYFFNQLGFLCIYLLLMILVNFIVKRNQMTKRNTFAILLFALFTVSFPEILKSGEILFSGFFLLLALRRAISLKSGVSTKKKIFDASFWLSVSALFFETSLLFFVIVFLAILFFAANDYRNWIIPIIGFMCVFVLTNCVYLLIDNSFVGIFHFVEAPNFDFSNYGSLPILLPLSLMLAFTLWTGANYLIMIKKAPSTMRSSLVLILMVWVVSLFVVIFSPTKNGGEFLFIIIPVSVIGAGYFEREGDKLFKKVLLVFLVLSILLCPLIGVETTI